MTGGFGEIYKRFGQGLARLGFISPRPIGNATSLYGDVFGCWKATLESDRILLHRYNESVNGYVPLHERSIMLPFTADESMRLVHLGSTRLAKNSYGQSFAILCPEGEGLKVRVARRVTNIGMLPDVEVRLKNLSAGAPDGLLELRHEIEDSLSAAQDSHSEHRFDFPFKSGCGIYGGMDTIVLHDRESGRVCSLRFSGGTPAMRNHKELSPSGTNTIFEILGQGRFAMLDGSWLALPAEGKDTRMIDVFEAAKDAGMDPSVLNYMLIGAGNGADLVLYPPGLEKCLVLGSDETSPDFGRLVPFSR